VAWQNGWHQIDRRQEGMSWAGKNVVVRRWLEGTEQLLYRGQKLVWRKLSARPERGSAPRVAAAIQGDPTPAAGQAGRGMGGAVGKEFGKAVKKQGRLARAQRRAAASGLPPSPALRCKKEQKQRLSRKGHYLVR
jgi:hypothetical protein